MKFSVVIIIACLIHSICNAQIDTNTITDKRISIKFQELRAKRIDTIVCYYINCTGDMPREISDSCKAYDIKYLLWADMGKYFIERIDECNTHKAFAMDGHFFNFLHQKFSVITKESIKYPSAYEKVNGKVQLLDVYRDHSCHYIFEIHTGNKTLIKDIDDFALDTKYLDNKHRNINYRRNQTSALNKLKIILEKDAIFRQ